LEAQKYLRLDDQNQMISDLQMNDLKIVRLADATAPADGVNKKTLDAAVTSLRSENEQLILATNENIARRVMFLDGTSPPENHQNYNDERITNLGQPVEPDDAAKKRFVGNIPRKRTFYVNPQGAQENLKTNNHAIPDFLTQQDPMTLPTNFILIHCLNIFKPQSMLTSHNINAKWKTFRPASSDSNDYRSGNQLNQMNEENKFKVLINVLLIT